ncbi:rhomboid family intramembrane serine protease [Sphingomonas psychrotolerans]|uniref:Rhomboid family intramembrane serine protease n=1 Tax=Sphingomonas psychrotolerans TaxID=1327635 RepID=A0A2K8MJT6_9SPHN|nr:rhomboid family intramembrane serine protease [Sphingomonas psychrotolerans]ATY31461.1 rhomboid family intramembrane serine protease [Sphingomonas psychrotolerans]
MRRSSATAVLIIVTAVVSIVVTLGGVSAYEASMRAGFIPARLSGIETDYLAVPALLTPLSCTLLHAGLLHLAMNMLMLGFTGRETERAVGPWGILILYVVGAYAAAFAQWLPDPQSITPMIGASGAASAVVGAYSLLFGRSRAQAIGPIPAQAVHVAWLAVAWTVLNLMTAYAFLGAGVAVAAGAHIGGFLAGLALAKPLLMWRWRRA